VGACDLVLSHQALNATTFRDPSVGDANPMLKSPQVIWLGDRARPRPGREAEWADRW
jgi:hypothetical protein